MKKTPPPSDSRRNHLFRKSGLELSALGVVPRNCKCGSLSLRAFSRVYAAVGAGTQALRAGDHALHARVGRALNSAWVLWFWRLSAFEHVKLWNLFELKGILILLFSLQKLSIFSYCKFNLIIFLMYKLHQKGNLFFTSKGTHSVS